MAIRGLAGEEIGLEYLNSGHKLLSLPSQRDELLAFAAGAKVLPHFFGERSVNRILRCRVESGMLILLSEGLPGLVPATPAEGLRFHPGPGVISILFEAALVFTE